MQHSEEDKARQIGNMDEIYRSALFTIIAAAGLNPSHGLPSVSMPRRLGLQPIVTVNDKSFTWSLQDSSELVTRSKWNTRAWTYQEIVFSTRRLIFTDQQMFWLVGNYVPRSETCPESNNVRFGEHVASANFRDWRNTREEVFTHIKNYSKRQLTFHSDIIKGMEGIFKTAYGQMLRDSPNHCNYGCGIYVWPEVLGVEVFPRSKPHHFWGILLHEAYTDGDVIRSLIWSHISGSKRQPDFPSWSWTGWTGAVQFNQFAAYVPWTSILHWFHDERGFRQLEFEVQIQVMTQHGSDREPASSFMETFNALVR